MLRYSIEEGRLVGGSCPTPDELRNLKEEGFDAIISLLDNDRQYEYSPEEAQREFLWHNVPMRDHATPTLGQLSQFHDVLRALPASALVYVHCYAGIGRTGTVAASYLVLRGMDVEEAYARVNAWTGGFFLREVGRRQEELDRLMRSLNELFSSDASSPRR